jgi:hypothetical protein
MTLKLRHRRNGAQTPLIAREVSMAVVRGPDHTSGNARQIAHIVALEGSVGHSPNEHDHPLTLVAEGVETQAQANLLLALHCIRAQGWLYAPAVAAAKLTPLLSTVDQVTRRASV